MKKILFSAVMLCFATMAIAQYLYEPEGINMPGNWNGWTNVPTNNTVLANPSQVSGGQLIKISTGTVRWRAIFSAASSGGNVVDGNHDFKFSSGPTGSPWNNQWGGTGVTMNTLQTHFIGAGGNSNITLTNGKWYTMNYIDNGYNNAQAIFMETSSQPVLLSSSSQAPTNGNVTDTDAVVVTVNTSAAPSAEEIVYVRWTNNNFTTSTLVPVSFTGAVGTATIPAQAAATQVDYYFFSTTVTSPPVADADKVTIRFLNAGPGNYTYTVNTPLPQVNITFQVDMSQQTVGGSVYISGSFNGWAPALMTNGGGGLYTYAGLFNQGASFEYKFVNGASYEGNISNPCGNGNNRTYTVGGSDATVALTCFGLCGACPATNNVTFRVNMSNETVGANVYVNGSFPPANWSTPQQMTAVGGGVYSYTVNLPQGASYEYKFINGASYEGNLGGPCGNGNNRTLSVAVSANTALPVACFSSCNNCVVLPQVTFNVNVSNQIVAAGGVHLAGNFGSAGYPEWSPSGIPMTDANGDGVYSVTLNLNPNSSHEYKFLLGNSWGTDESVPGPCNVFGNRTITVVNSNISISAVCYGECSACTSAIVNDSPYAATNVSYSSNGAYPNCYVITGDCTNAGDSPQSSNFNGNDVWYKFTAQSSAVSITLTSGLVDDVIELYTKTGDNFTLVPGGVENAGSGNGDFERLNIAGLTAGNVYYISVGSASNVASGVFTLCIQHLMPSWCAYTIPVNGFPLCNSYKAIFRGSSSQFVSYGFNFTGVGGGASGTTSVTGTNGLTSLSNPTLNLRYGGVYDVTVDVLYSLTNSVGAAEPITVLGSASAANCSGVTISAQPLIEVKSSQRCPGSLLRSNYLIGTPIAGNTNACGATDYTYEFTPVTNCGNNSPIGLATPYATPNSNPYMPLGVLPYLGNAGAWSVRIRPEFAYGSGVYGPAQLVSVGNTAASIMLPEDGLIQDNEKSMTSSIVAGIYPNPNDGKMLNINLTDLKGTEVFMRVVDYTGRVIYSNRFIAQESLNTVVIFDQPLASGMYVIEFINGQEIRTEKMIVRK